MGYSLYFIFYDGYKDFVKKEDLKGTRREIKEKAAEKSLRFLYEQFDGGISIIYRIQNREFRIQHVK